jgi:catechol 2,3-dioxygenase-like lactoylglutathione lyase family enzyme
LGEDGLAAVFETGGVTLRVSTIADFTPHGHTILGFRVADVAATVRALAGAGVTVKRIPGLAQDELGVFTAPGGVHVAWFEDPDGNVLSVTDV